MLEAGHNPQHLLAHLNNEAGLNVAVQREISRLQRQGLDDLASGLQQRAGLPRSATRAPGGLQHYAQGAIWRARLQRLNLERGVQEWARSGTTNAVLTRAAALLESKRINTAVHLLCSKAEACPYSPALEQALAEAAEAEENWLAALEHWQRILGCQVPASISVHAQQRLNELTSSAPLKQQQVVMEFDHLLFQEGVLTHAGPEPPAFASTKEAAAAFWQHDAKAEALLSPEINPLIWNDFRHDSSLQHAARYWLVQKLFHGRCLLKAIAHDGGVPIQAMARRCAGHFDPAHYLKQLNPGTTVSADTALTNYLSEGWTRNLDPSPSFSTTAALERDPLLRQFGINPLYATLCSGDPAGHREQITGQALMQRFPESTYFNPRFTWFTASPPGDHSCLDLHWVVDDFSPGSEGHTSIVPMLSQLEQQGHRITVWDVNPEHNQADQPIQATVLELDASFFFSSGDAVIATSSSTVDAVRRAKGFKARFHCIQGGEASAETDGLTALNLGDGSTGSQTFTQGLIKRLSAVAPNRTCDGIRLQGASAADAEPPKFKAAVVLPTHNAGPILQHVLNALKAQATPWEFQCVLIDSASTDGTLERLQGFAEGQAHVSIHRISQDEFQHGHTRNRGVAWSDAEFVAFLTQDAIPADEHWLVNLVSGLERQPDAAGCFGRHVAHDDAPWLIKQELERYFRALEQFPKALSIHTEPDRIRQKDQYWRKILHFYSDNNSCLRKSIWKEIPLPCIPFGEDQLWAEAIIRRGYTKVYAADAVVKHSHHYTAKETYNRARIEAEFYATCFGHSIHASRTGMDQAISRDCCDAVNRAIKAQDQCSAEHLAQQLECIIAKHCGGDPALRDTPQSKQASTDLRAVKVPKSSVELQSKVDVAMNMKEVFIKCCQAHQWPPIHINLDEHVQLDSTTIDAEAKAALSQGKQTLCLALIDLAKTFDLQSIEQLELKALALQQLQGKATAATQGITTADAALQRLVNRLLQTCQQQQWPPQFLQADATASDPWETEKTILQEAEAARNADRTELSLHLIETTLEAGFDSPWFHHLKARALQKLEKFAEAILIWEELSIDEIEGFSDTVRSSLKAARADQALVKARQQDASGALDAAIASLTSALLSDPEHKEMETSLKAMLRKRRRGGLPAEEFSPLEDHQDELDLNQAVLLQAEQLIDSQEAVQGAG